MFSKKYATWNKNLVVDKLYNYLINSYNSSFIALQYICIHVSVLSFQLFQLYSHPWEE